MRLIVEYAITQCVEFVVDDDITKSEAEMLADEYLSEEDFIRGTAAKPEEAAGESASAAPEPAGELAGA